MDADTDLLPFRDGVPEGGEPARRARPAAGRVDDEIRPEGLLRARPQTHAGHARAVRRRRQATGVAAVREPDVRQGAHPLTRDALEQRPGRGEELQLDVLEAEAPATHVEPQRTRAEDARPPCAQLVEGPREQLGQSLKSSRLQHVNVPALRYTLAVPATRDQAVALHNRHLLEPLGQDCGARQPRQAAAEYDRVLTDLHRGSRSHAPDAPA